MRLPLDAVKRDCFRLIYQNDIKSEETLEVVIPDVCGDAGTILDVRGQAYLTSKKIGEDRITACSGVRVSVIYAAEGTSQIHCIGGEIPFEVTVPAEGANSEGVLTVGLELCGLEAKILNSRKLILRAVLDTSLMCRVPDQFVSWEPPQGEDGANVQYLTKEIEHSLVTAVKEKTFTVTDEFSLPPERGPDTKMLSAKACVCITETKIVGNKLVIKASSRIDGLFMEGSGELFCGTFESKFSQLIEMDTAMDDTDVVVFPLIRDADYTRLSDKEVCAYALSLTVCAQAVCRQNVVTPYIADAYSNCFPLYEEYCDISIECIPARRNYKFELAGNIQHKENISEIVFMTPVTLCTEVDGGRLSCSVKALGTGKGEEGEFVSIAVELTDSDDIVLSKGQMMKVISACLTDFSVEGDMTIKAEVSVDLCIGEKKEVRAICALEGDTENYSVRRGMSTIIVLCSQAEMDLWTIAKKYGSTMELIEKANSCDCEFDPTKRPLLIPKA